MEHGGRKLSAPVIWIFIPAVFSILLLIFRNYRRFVNIAGLCIAFLLTTLAWLVPIDTPITINLGTLSFPIDLSGTFTIYGRNLIFTQESQQVLILIYFGLTFWYGGALTLKGQNLFIPISLLMTYRNLSRGFN